MRPLLTRLVGDRNGGLGCVEHWQAGDILDERAMCARVMRSVMCPQRVTVWNRVFVTVWLVVLYDETWSWSEFGPGGRVVSCARLPRSWMNMDVFLY